MFVKFSGNRWSLVSLYMSASTIKFFISAWHVMLRYSPSTDGNILLLVGLRIHYSAPSLSPNEGTNNCGHMKDVLISFLLPNLEQILHYNNRRYCYESTVLFIKCFLRQHCFYGCLEEKTKWYIQFWIRFWF